MSAGSAGLTVCDRVQALAALEAEFGQHETDSAAKARLLKTQIVNLRTDLNRISDGLDLEKIAQAEKILEVRGTYTKAGEERESVKEDALLWLAFRPTKHAVKGDLHAKYFGTKSYDRWHGQRSDHPYGYGPRHGSVIFSIGLSKTARWLEALSDGQREAASYYILNIERIQAARSPVSP